MNEFVNIFKQYIHLPTEHIQEIISYSDIKISTIRLLCKNSRDSVLEEYIRYVINKYPTFKEISSYDTVNPIIKGSMGLTYDSYDDIWWIRREDKFLNSGKTWALHTYPGRTYCCRPRLPDRYSIMFIGCGHIINIIKMRSSIKELIMQGDDEMILFINNHIKDYILKILEEIRQSIKLPTHITAEKDREDEITVIKEEVLMHYRSITGKEYYLTNFESLDVIEETIKITSQP